MSIRYHVLSETLGVEKRTKSRYCAHESQTLVGASQLEREHQGTQGQCYVTERDAGVRYSDAKWWSVWTGICLRNHTWGHAEQPFSPAGRYTESCNNVGVPDRLELPISPWTCSSPQEPKYSLSRTFQIYTQAKLVSHRKKQHLYSVNLVGKKYENIRILEKTRKAFYQWAVMLSIIKTQVEIKDKPKYGGIVAARRRVSLH